MSAPDYETIYDYEGAIEKAVKDLLTTNGITAYRQRDLDEAKTPYVAVQLNVGAASGHLARLPNGDFRPDQLSGQLKFAITTNRGQNNADHPTIRAKIRNLMYRAWGTVKTLTQTELPYHVILPQTVLEAGTVQSVGSDEDHDISTITFNLGFGIRPDAWPV